MFGQLLYLLYVRIACLQRGLLTLMTRHLEGPMNDPSLSGTVYILGAGASAELKFPMTTLDSVQPPRTNNFDVKGPLSSGFFFYLNQFSDAVQQHSKFLFALRPEDVLIRYCCEQYAEKVLKTSISPAQLLGDEDRSRLFNIEALYRHLQNELERAPTVLDALEGPGAALMALERYIGEGLSYISHFCYSEHHDRFVRSLRPNDVIISFNWDVLIEQVMHQSIGWSYETGYGVVFDQVRHKTDRNYARQAIPSPNLVLKPHGSINWYGPSQSEALNLVIPAEWNLRGGGGWAVAIDTYEKDLGMSKLSAPGEGKFVTPAVSHLVKLALEQAREIIAIGFSFNEFDAAVEQEFYGFSYRDDLAVHLVNPSGLQLTSTYQKIFRTAKVDVVAETFGKFVRGLQLNSSSA
jgi:hypothetical protein